MLWYIPLALGALIALRGLWEALYTLTHWNTIATTVEALISFALEEARVFRDEPLPHDQEALRPMYIADAESAAQRHRENDLPGVRFVRGCRWIISGGLIMFAAWLVHIYT